jgi:hypothetical protein
VRVPSPRGFSRPINAPYWNFINRLNGMDSCFREFLVINQPFPIKVVRRVLHLSAHKGSVQPKIYLSPTFTFREFLQIYFLWSSGFQMHKVFG